MKMLLEAENQPQKRIKCEEDRISALPDCLLHDILSRLPHTKHAIRTGILSKRWAYLWTCVPSLIFSHKDLPPLTQPKSRSDYALLVDKTISQCRQVKLNKFKVHTFYDIRFESQFKNWLRYAISCNVEELTLKFCYNGRREAEFQFVLDQFLFSNSNFTDLTLKGCKLNPTGAISWKNLRRLCITYLNLDEDLIMNIVSGSPQLETLELEDKHITSESKSEDEAEIKINALSLTQCPQLNLKKFQVFTRFRSEFESHFNSWIRYAIRCGVRELDLSLSNLYEDEFMNIDQILFTSSCITDLIICGCMVNPVGAISWKNLKTLSISETSYGSIDEDLIENILSGSPVLETLELDNCYAYRRINITTSKSVKNLVFSDYSDSHDHSESEANNIFEINAPNILSLTIRGHVFPGKLLLLNVSSLVNVDLRYYFTKTMRCSTEAEEEMLKGYILNLGHVKELKIWFSCYEAVSRLQAKGFIFPSNVKLHGAGFEKTKKLNSYLGI